MKNIINKLFVVIKHLRYELLSGIVTGVFLLFISLIIDFYIPSSDPFKKVITLSTFIIATLLLIILIKLKQTLEGSLNNVSHILYSQFGFIAYGNEYYRRLRHFTVEKDFLADILVRKALPNLINKIKNEKRKYDKIILILDSGTTITPIFLKLLQFGIKKVDSKKIEVFTNNLAGIDEIQKPVNTTFYALNENNFNVIAGTPLKTYRAITGPITEKFLKTQLWDSEEKDKAIIISVVTANWIVANNQLSTIKLCARGQGHLNFKKEVVQHSDYTFVVAPLTKIIKVENMDTLNNIVPYEDEYKDYAIPVTKKDTTILLTSYRPSNTLSPLLIHSRNLKSSKDQKQNTNFIFSEDNKLYSPKGDRIEVRECELPHSYILDSFKEMYGYELSDVN